jgi:hypothetical protein
MLAGPNAIDPNRMTAAERLAEVAEIVAAGLVRFRSRQSSRLSADSGESSLHFMPAESGSVPCTETVGRGE